MIGSLAFLNPWLLGALAVLPVIWWLLRTTPPRPETVAFPPTRILEGLVSREKTPARSPWWLTLIRLLAATAIIFALAEPVLNPNSISAARGDRLVVVIDNGWASASNWERRRAALDRLITDAGRNAQPVLVIATAVTTATARARFQPAERARETAAGFLPLPYAPDRKAVLERLRTTLTQSGAAATQIIWLSDGIDYGEAKNFGAGLIELAGDSGRVSVAVPGGTQAAVGLRKMDAEQHGLRVELLTLASPTPRSRRIVARSSRGLPLAERDVIIPPATQRVTATFDLPLELRNQVARIEITGANSAGAVQLLDANSRFNRVGLFAATAREKDQPLLAPLYYLNRALAPFTDVVQSSQTQLPPAIRELIERKASTLVLANIGTLGPEVAERLEAWVKEGGILVRFAGSRLEQIDDALLPTPLRSGDRTLGGALSWSKPQNLAPMDRESLFAGLEVRDDISVRRQVLADPSLLDPTVTKIWARLSDGTPLVTARAVGGGWVVLFHITANSDWSNLPLSGLFVAMLKRIIAVGGADVSATGQAGRTRTAASDGGTSDRLALLAPRRILDGHGVLGAPPPTARPLAAQAFATTQPGPRHPPGFYGGGDTIRALNVLNARSKFAALPGLTGVERVAYQAGDTQVLKPWLFLAALALLLLDGLGVLAIAGARPFARRGAVATMLLGLLAMPGLAGDARAQSTVQPPAPPGSGASTTQTDDAFALLGALETRFAYVITGDAGTDDTSRMGLHGLKTILARRTAVEAGEPVGIDLTRDELGFFPILYWPVLANAQPLPPDQLAKIDAYMKNGGLIIFDTRDFGEGMTGLGGGGSGALQRMLGKLSIPTLEPVPDGHVLTKSFYLLRDFPGRWDGGRTWVEASTPAPVDGTRKAQRSDGVSSLIISSNDLAAAWAIDDTGQPAFNVVPGGALQREMAYRTGVNIVMYALTGNYKADQVHIPDLLRRLGQ